MKPCQCRIQDFLEGAPTPKVWVLTYHFANFLPQTAWKWKNLDLGGGARAPGAPWDLPVHVNLQDLAKFEGILLVGYKLISQKFSSFCSCFPKYVMKYHADFLLFPIKKDPQNLVVIS